MFGSFFLYNESVFINLKGVWIGCKKELLNGLIIEKVMVLLFIMKKMRFLFILLL